MNTITLVGEYQNEARKAKQIGLSGHNCYQWLACRLCGKERWVVLLKARNPGSDLCYPCGTAHFKYRRGITSPIWKGGRRKVNGYIMVYLPDGHKFASMRVGGRKKGQHRYIAEHRLVMAEHLGRTLARDEIVHHKDGTRSNNKIENLELTTLGVHSREHGIGYQHGFQQGYADGLACAKERQ